MIQFSTNKVSLLQEIIMAIIKEKEGRLIRRQDNEIIQIEAWGAHALRVRITRNNQVELNENWALLVPQDTGSVEIEIHDPDKKKEIQFAAGGADSSTLADSATARIRNGNITAEINHEGWLSFYNQHGELLLQEYWRNRARLDRFNSPLNVDGRELKGNLGGAWQASIRFEADDREKIFGMGQYQDPYLDKKGTVLELAHRNAQSCVPFYTSSLGYGFLWNNPAIGSVSFAKNLTEWKVPVTDQVDYWITAGDSPAQIQEQYTAVTGRVPMMPDFGLGFTQCRMRYRNQQELMDVAREHKRRGLPMDMIVADFFHWTTQGDWKFDETDWPDVEGMVKELKEMGIELMVSIWPTVDTRSENREEMEERGLLIQVDRGHRINMNWMGETAFFDATNPEAREFIWKKARENYFDKGIKVFWLDEAEPELGIYDFDIYRYWKGPALKVSSIYPYNYTQAFYDGLIEQGMKQPLNLVRTAWAGSQRLGALVWSGDIHSSYRSMREQLAAGLSISMAGIPWWTTDIGGFHSGYPEHEDFREMLVRWFQWGVFCPVFRLHGDRLPYRKPDPEVRNGIQQFGSGWDNEIWSFGEKAYPILEFYLHLRERLKPYIKGLMKEAHLKGTPVFRPLFYDFPQDQASWNCEDAYMFGPDLLVAPIMEAETYSRKVYLPAGAKWTNAWTDEVLEGGQEIKVEAPFEQIPLFLKDGASLPIRE